MNGSRASKDAFANKPEIKIVDVVDIKAMTARLSTRRSNIWCQTGPKKIDAFVSLESSSGKIVQMR